MPRTADHLPKDGKQAIGHDGSNAGRKPSAATILKRAAIENSAHEAEKSLQFCIEMRDREDVLQGIRLAAAQEVMDRIWGKPKQMHDLKVNQHTPEEIKKMQEDLAKFYALHRNGNS